MDSNQPRPRFREGQLVHLTTPLNPSALSTWIFEGEVEFPKRASDTQSSSQAGFSTEAANIGSSTVNVNTETSEPQSSDAVASGAQTTGAFVSQILTEKVVKLIPNFPHYNTIRHCTAWEVESVVEAENEGEEHKYTLKPAEAVTAYVEESSLREAEVFVGTVVRKQGQREGFWVVAGLSINHGRVLADIISAAGNVEVVLAKELKMLPPAEARRVLAA